MPSTGFSSSVGGEALNHQPDYGRAIGGNILTPLRRVV